MPVCTPCALEGGRTRRRLDILHGVRPAKLPLRWMRAALVTAAIRGLAGRLTHEERAWFTNFSALNVQCTKPADRATVFGEIRRTWGLPDRAEATDRERMCDPRAHEHFDECAPRRRTLYTDRSALADRLRALPGAMAATSGRRSSTSLRRRNNVTHARSEQIFASSSNLRSVHSEWRIFVPPHWSLGTQTALTFTYFAYYCTQALLWVGRKVCTLALLQPRVPGWKPGYT